MSLNELSQEIHRIAVDRGWYDTERVRAFDGMMMNIVAEVAEAQEEWRKGSGYAETYYNDDKPDKPEGIPTELADVIIRVLDVCAWLGIDIDRVLREKINYNSTRPYRHGGKRS